MPGEEARFKLSPEYAVHAFQLLFDVWDDGAANVSAASFTSDFCLPMKHVEGWVRTQVRTFGSVATQFAAFARVCKTLVTEGGRQKVLLCLRERIPLSGKPDSKSGDAGIDECRTIVAEMRKLKAGTAPGKEGAKHEQGDAVAEKPEQDGGDVEDAAEQAAAAMEIDIEEDLPPPEVTDPVVVKARSLAASELCHVSVHTDREAFVKDLNSRVMPSAKARTSVSAAFTPFQLTHGSAPLGSLQPTCLLARAADHLLPLASSA